MNTPPHTPPAPLRPPPCPPHRGQELEHAWFHPGLEADFLQGHGIAGGATAEAEVAAAADAEHAEILLEDTHEKIPRRQAAHGGEREHELTHAQAGHHAGTVGGRHEGQPGGPA